mmetsp:Transcript_28500/g.91331  ORF Transcript_28500/g.91331 Transcript_28500/m.91331 type:complete len:270 (+) Transcript_28500:1917-2726(+)
MEGAVRSRRWRHCQRRSEPHREAGARAREGRSARAAQRSRGFRARGAAEPAWRGPRPRAYRERASLLPLRLPGAREVHPPGRGAAGGPAAARRRRRLPGELLPLLQHVPLAREGWAHVGVRLPAGDAPRRGAHAVVPGRPEPGAPGGLRAQGGEPLGVPRRPGGDAGQVGPHARGRSERAGHGRGACPPRDGARAGRAAAHLPAALQRQLLWHDPAVARVRPRVALRARLLSATLGHVRRCVGVNGKIEGERQSYIMRDRKAYTGAVSP